MEGKRISYHDSVLKVYERIKNDNMTNIWDRFEAQGFGKDPDKRCPFCMGVSDVIYALMDPAVQIQKKTKEGCAVLQQMAWLCA